MQHRTTGYEQPASRDHQSEVLPRSTHRTAAGLHCPLRLRFDQRGARDTLSCLVERKIPDAYLLEDKGVRGWLALVSQRHGQRTIRPIPQLHHGAAAGEMQHNFSPGRPLPC